MADRRIRDPIVLLGAPRSGTTMLFNALAGHPDLWSLYSESGPIIDRFFPSEMTPGRSDAVPASEVPDESLVALRRAFAQEVGNIGSAHLTVSNAVSSLLRTSVGRRLVRLPLISRFRLSMVYSKVGHARKDTEVRIVEKTPLNCLRVGLMDRIFPDAKYVYLTRDPRQSIASIHKAWTQSVEFRRYRFPPGFELLDYDGDWWCFGLIPGWEDLNGVPLIEVCARQWLMYNQLCQRDLPGLGDRTKRVTYEDLVSKPGAVLRELADWAELDWAPFERFGQSLPIVNTYTSPREDKWRSLEREIRSVHHLIREEAVALGYGI